MRDEDIIRYIDLAKKKIPYFLRKIQGKVEGLITFDDIESEVMFSIIQYYDTIKNFELENPDEIERYLFGVVKNITLNLIKKEAKHQQNRVKVNCGESEVENDEIEENRFFVNEEDAEDILQKSEDRDKLNKAKNTCLLLKNLLEKIKTLNKIKGRIKSTRSNLTNCYSHIQVCSGKFFKTKESIQHINKLMKGL